MRFFAIRKTNASDNDRRIELLDAACQQRDVEFVSLHADELDFTELPQLGAGDMLYQIDAGSLIAERMLITPQVATFYKDFHRSLFQQWQLFNYFHHEVPMPKTIPYLTRDPELLKKYVDYMGGFPIIVKALGGSHGVGVIKVDSMGGLLSILDHFPHNRRVIMREFIDQKRHARLIVIGNQVVDSIEYVAEGDEFRTNVGSEPTVQPKKFDADVEATAVKSVTTLELEFGGVDIMFDGDGNHYVLEMNFPCYYARVQDTTGNDVAGMMVDYLMEKSKRLADEPESV